MRRANQVIGLPIISAATSRKIGTISDVAYAPARDQVVGFLVDGADHDALPFSMVSSISADTVITPHDTPTVDSDADPMIKLAVDSSVKFDGLTVVGSDGDQIGTIEDTFFDERSGRIAGFQVAPRDRGGVLGMQTGGRRRGKLFLPMDRVSDWDENRMRVMYTGTTRDMYDEEYPEGYDEYGQSRAA